MSEAEDPEDRWLPLPPQFDGGAMLEALTLDVVSGDTVFVDEVPVLYRSWAEESASALLHEAGDAGDDPVLEARLDLVRKAFSSGTTRRRFRVRRPNCVALSRWAAKTDRTSRCLA